MVNIQVNGWFHLVQRLQRVGEKSWRRSCPRTSTCATSATTSPSSSSSFSSSPSTSSSSSSALSTSVTFPCSGFTDPQHHRHPQPGHQHHDAHHQRVHPKPNVPALTCLRPNSPLQLRPRPRSRPPLLHHHPQVSIADNDFKGEPSKIK